ncbi:proline dehydrogenase family protein [Cytobacillus gottheilii]|uniref:proline dehydrogenase n=1 Tax=Cytobacillus gottheilii TaxID=859144 RepID=A0ABX8F9C3_9BACI|nr:proline dehydrogenase family protein [Cytobacillus gottheilii]QVY61018.1 proline dehydrogenase family protein [Cytobacillus gottheilii]
MTALRNIFLFLSKNKRLTMVAKKYGFRFGASRYIAGKNITEAVEVIKSLDRKGLSVTVDCLGEFVDNEAEANATANHLVKLIETLGQESLDAEISVKLTSLGLDISNDLALRNMKRILDAAEQQNIFVTIDMEDSLRCGQTLEIFTLLKLSYKDIGTVIQAYLYRTMEDMHVLNPYSPSLRLVKGAYKESPEVAFSEKQAIDDNFKKIIEMHLRNGHYTAIATHDDDIIEYTKQLVTKYQIPYSQFEFQLLYGVKVDRQLELRREGYKVRLYVPFGEDWFGYYMRRMAEYPANPFLHKNKFTGKKTGIHLLQKE